MDDEFRRLLELVRSQPVADPTGYLSCKSYDTLPIETAGDEYAFLAQVPYEQQNCLLVRAALAILEPIAAFLASARQDGGTAVYAMVSVTDFLQFPREGPRHVDGTNGRLGIGIWCGNFANPMLRSFALESRSVETEEGRFVRNCVGSDASGIEIHEVFDETMARHILDGIFVRSLVAEAPWSLPPHN
jgi:hypothetical protein